MSFYNVRLVSILSWTLSRSCGQGQGHSTDNSKKAKNAGVWPIVFILNADLCACVCSICDHWNMHSSSAGFQSTTDGVWMSCYNVPVLCCSLASILLRLAKVWSVSIHQHTHCPYTCLAIFHSVHNKCHHHHFSVRYPSWMILAAFRSCSLLSAVIDAKYDECICWVIDVCRIDVTEGQISITLLYLICAAFGSTFWSYEVPKHSAVHSLFMPSLHI